MPIQDILTLLLLLLLCGLTVATLFKKTSSEIDPKALKDELDRLDNRLRTEFAASRQENADSAKNLRQELIVALQELSRMLQGQISFLGDGQHQQFKEFSERLDALRNALTQADQAQREELTRNQQGFTDALMKRIGELGDAQEKQLDRFARTLEEMTKSSEANAKSQREELNASLKEFREMVTNAVMDQGKTQQEQFSQFTMKLEKLNSELIKSAQDQRKEQTENLKGFNDSTLKGMALMATQQKEQLEILRAQVGELSKTNETKLVEMATSNAAKLGEMSQSSDKKMEELRLTLDQKLERVRQTVVEQLDRVRQENEKKLEEMRKTVDDKLHDTLEKRLGESFKQVSDRLEQVHKGLGEMQNLAIGVGDLKKVLTNVKTRGTWGEIQLGNLLEQILTPEQYVKDARPKPRSQETVEYAIKLPGRDEDDIAVLLPIDAKFPKEDYERLVEASEKADIHGVEVAIKQLEARIKQEARNIRDKYIAPPHTTDFAILYLPIEGLYAEVLRRPGLVETLQRDYRVSIAGPTTLAALLNSLQMGFRTLAIQKRSSEVWKILAAVKKKFEAFGKTFAQVQKKIQDADKALEIAKEDTRIMGDKLKGVEAMTDAEATRVLSLPEANLEADIETDDDSSKNEV